MNPSSDDKQISGIDILRQRQVLYFELNDNLTWRFLREVEELSLTDYSEEQIRKAFSNTRKLKEAKQFLSIKSIANVNPDKRLTLDQALLEISNPSVNLESPILQEDSISQDNLATQAYSSNYLDSISHDESYWENGLISEEEILRGFVRISADELLSQEELNQVQIIRDFDIIYNEQDS